MTSLAAMRGFSISVFARRITHLSHWSKNIKADYDLDGTGAAFDRGCVKTYQNFGEQKPAFQIAPCSTSAIQGRVKRPPKILKIDLSRRFYTVWAKSGREPPLNHKWTLVLSTYHGIIVIYKSGSTNNPPDHQHCQKATVFQNTRRPRMSGFATLYERSDITTKKSETLPE